MNIENNIKNIRSMVRLLRIMGQMDKKNKPVVLREPVEVNEKNKKKTNDLKAMQQLLLIMSMKDKGGKGLKRKSKAREDKGGKGDKRTAKAANAAKACILSPTH